MHARSLAVSLGAALAAVVVAVSLVAPAALALALPVVSIAVSGNHLVDGEGKTVVLRGADMSGPEYACVQFDQIFDGSEEASAGSIAAMRSWSFNAVRVPLNESCWLGVQGVKSNVSGKPYRDAIARYVNELIAAGMYVVLDMHWSSTGGTRKAARQQPMPDEHYAPAYWSSVANAFKGNPAVIFDLYNEPYPNRNTDTEAAWKCDRDGSAGGTCKGFTFAAAGMQQLLNSVRETGASNVVMVGGPQYAGVLDRWAQFAPKDPLGQLAASIHVYFKSVSEPEWTPCANSACWSGVLAPLSAQVPIVMGEFGELDCAHTLYPPLLNFADEHGISYLGWAWFAGSCTGEPSLITSYNGTPSAYGVGYKEHLEALGL